MKTTDTSSHWDRRSPARSLLFAAVVVVLAVVLTSCGGGSKSGGILSGDQPSPQSKGQLKLGPRDDLGTLSVPKDGGKLVLQKPNSPLDGFEINVPKDSYDGARDFKVSSRPITSQTFGDKISPISQLITVDNGGGYANDVMTVKVPVKVPQGQFAMAFFYNEKTQALEGMPLVTEDANSVTVQTRHFSDFFITAVADVVLKNVNIDTGYRPGVDDWQFKNRGPYTSPNGICAGMSATSIWYYYERKQQDGQLHGRFDNYKSGDPATPAFWEDDNLAYRWAATVQRDMQWDTLLTNLARPLMGTSDPLQFLAFAYAFEVTRGPQITIIYNHDTGAGHAVVAYKIDSTGLWIADPNRPGEESTGREIMYSGAAFQPYNSALNAESPPLIFDQVGYVGVTGIFDWGKIGQRFAEMEAGAVGGDYFPAYHLFATSASLKSDIPLVDGVALPDPYFDFQQHDVSGTWSYLVYRDGKVVPFTDKGFALNPGKNELGVYVQKWAGDYSATAAQKDVRSDGSTIDRYVDYYRVTVYYNQVTIPPITGKAGDDIEIKAEMPAPPKDGRYEWSFGDGTPGENLSLKANHVFVRAGTYNVTLDVYDEATDNLAGHGEAVARIGQGTATATPPPATTTTGTGQWVLKTTAPNTGKTEANCTTGCVEGISCNVLASANSTASSATITRTGTCQHPDALPVNEVTEHSWPQPPAKLTPGQKITGSVSVTQSGYCWISGEQSLPGCRQAARTSLLVLQGSGDASQKKGDQLGIVYTQKPYAQASEGGSAPFSWEVPKGSTGRNVLIVQFIAHSNSGEVKTDFWYEWQGP